MSDSGEMRFPLQLITILAVLSFVPAQLKGQAATLSVDVIAAEIIEAQVKAFPIKNEERQMRAQELFQGVGCPKLLTVPVGKKPVPASIACIFPGESRRAILVGAHFDKVDQGEGKIDNATGTVLLSALARSLAGKPRKHTFIFAAFAEEEVGLKGSSAMVKQGLDGITGKEWIESISAMVNIDSVGAGPLAVASSSSDKLLAEEAFQMAERLGLPMRAVNVDQVGASDGRTFAQKKVRVVEFHSLDNSNIQVLHSKLDNMSAFRVKEYWEAYKVIAFLLAKLDGDLDR